MFHTHYIQSASGHCAMLVHTYLLCCLCLPIHTFLRTLLPHLPSPPSTLPNPNPPKEPLNFFLSSPTLYVPVLIVYYLFHLTPLQGCLVNCHMSEESWHSFLSAWLGLYDMLCISIHSATNERVSSFYVILGSISWQHISFIYSLVRIWVGSTFHLL